MGLESDEEVRQQCDKTTVDVALEYVCTVPVPSDVEQTLAYEVRRLREKLEQALVWHADQVKYIQVIEEYRDRLQRIVDEKNESITAYAEVEHRMLAKLACVEALPAKWLGEYERSGHDIELSSCEACAAELDAALRDEPITAPSKDEPMKVGDVDPLLGTLTSIRHKCKTCREWFDAKNDDDWHCSKHPKADPYNGY